MAFQRCALRSFGPGSVFQHLKEVGRMWVGIVENRCDGVSIHVAHCLEGFAIVEIQFCVILETVIFTTSTECCACYSLAKLVLPSQEVLLDVRRLGNHPASRCYTLPNVFQHVQKRRSNAGGEGRFTYCREEYLQQTSLARHLSLVQLRSPISSCHPLKTSSRL